MTKQHEAFSTRILGASTPVPALWNDGRSPEDLPVLVKAEMSPDRLVLCTPEGKECAVWPMTEVELFFRKNMPPMQLLWRPWKKAVAGRQIGRLLVEDEDAACKLLPYLESCQDGPRKSAMRRWCAIIFCAWIAISVIYSFTPPLLFQQWAGRIPRDLEDSLGASARVTIAEVFSMLPDSRGECALRTGGPELENLKTRLAQAVDTGGHVFDIRFLDSPMINSFALPGGAILLTTGLLRACASAEELAGVVAVEMAHIIQRHPSELVLREQGWALLVHRLRGTDYSATASEGLVRQALTGAYDPAQVQKAAALAAQRLAAAGFHIATAADFFSRLRASAEPAYGKVLSYAASHPDLAKQEEILRMAAAAQSGEYMPVLDAEAWERLRQAPCLASAAPTN
jgi:hypothetical protein